MNHCEHCGKEISKGSKYLCWQCHSTKKLWQPAPVCSRCNRIAVNLIKGLCPICNTAKWNKEHRADITAKEKIRRSNNIERYRESDLRRNQTDKRKTWKREYRKAYYEQNKDKLQAYNREWMRSHKEEMNHYHAIRHTRKNQLPATLTKIEWQEILIENNHRCFYCGEDSLILHKEHKIPISRGGGFTKDNIVPACGSCNSQKSFRTPEEFTEYLKHKIK